MPWTIAPFLMDPTPSTEDPVVPIAGRVCPSSKLSYPRGKGLFLSGRHPKFSSCDTSMDDFLDVELELLLDRLFMDWVAISKFSAKGNEMNSNSANLTRFGEALRNRGCDVWVWGWVRPHFDLSKAKDALIQGAQDAGASGIIIDIEEHWFGSTKKKVSLKSQAKKLKSFMDELVPAANSKNLAIGVSTYEGVVHRSSLATELLRGDFWVPQIYDKDNEEKPKNYKSYIDERFQNFSEFDKQCARVVVPALPAWKGNKKPYKTANDLQLFVDAGKARADGAVIFWYDYNAIRRYRSGEKCHSELRQTERVPVVAAMDFGPPGRKRPIGPNQDGTRGHIWGVPEVAKNGKTLNYPPDGFDYLGDKLWISRECEAVVEAANWWTDNGISLVDQFVTSRNADPGNVDPDAVAQSILETLGPACAAGGRSTWGDGLAAWFDDLTNRIAEHLSQPA